MGRNDPELVGERESRRDRAASGTSAGIRKLLSPMLFVAGMTLLAAQIVHTWAGLDDNGKPKAVGRDFADFYCAGAARNAGFNPYLSKGYDTCGNGGPASNPPKLYVHRNPAPIPGYDIALFQLLARLPYIAASYAWLCLSLIAFTAAIFFLSASSTLPPLLLLACFGMEILVSGSFGQLIAVAILGLTAAAYFVGRGRYGLASAAALLGLIEPHVGLPACAAMFVWLPRTRVSLAIGALLLATISVATLGVWTNVEYFTQVLPLHALAETVAPDQYSATSLFYLLGVDELAAVKFGSLSYALSLLLGIALAGPVSRSFKSDAVIPLLPSAVVVIGGPYIHGLQMFVLAMAALLLAGRSRRPEYLLWCSVGLVSVLWLGPGIESAFVFAVIFAFAARRLGTRAMALTASAAVCVYVGLTVAILQLPNQPLRVPETPAQYAQRVASKMEYADAVFGIRLRSDPAVGVSESSVRLVASRVPLWIAPLLLLAAVLRQLGRRRQPTALGAATG